MLSLDVCFFICLCFFTVFFILFPQNYIFLIGFYRIARTHIRKTFLINKFYFKNLCLTFVTSKRNNNLKSYIMTSFITLPIQKILFQNKIWSIELLKNGHEIVISNQYTVCYGYPDLKNNTIRYDRICFPKYIGQKALQLCKSNNINFY